MDVRAAADDIPFLSFLDLSSPPTFSLLSDSLHLQPPVAQLALSFSLLYLFFLPITIIIIVLFIIIIIVRDIVIAVDSFSLLLSLIDINGVVVDIIIIFNYN